MYRSSCSLFVLQRGRIRVWNDTLIEGGSKALRFPSRSPLGTTGHPTMAHIATARRDGVEDGLRLLGAYATSVPGAHVSVGACLQASATAELTCRRRSRQHVRAAYMGFWPTHTETKRPGAAFAGNDLACINGPPTLSQCVRCRGLWRSGASRSRVHIDQANDAMRCCQVAVLGLHEFRFRNLL